MKPEVRALEGRDHEVVVALSLRAWAPVFESLERVLGESGVYAHLHPDWRVSQRRAVDAVCSGEGIHVWVADAPRGGGRLDGRVDSAASARSRCAGLVMMTPPTSAGRRRRGSRSLARTDSAR